MYKKNAKVTIIDYGIGNLFSIERALSYVGADTLITDDPLNIVSADRVILPGVGAFGVGFEELKKRLLIDSIKDFIKKDRPLLGICLGMQLLMSKSYEFGLNKGLDLVSGEVVRFRDPEPGNDNFKIPHIGWNKAEFSSEHSSRLDSILKRIPSGSFFYFVHSYVTVMRDINDIAAESQYGRDRFCSILNKGNIWGCQFHPEKSGKVGLKLLENFCSL